ncbi:MAG: hypothetical protein KatS3mg042_0688 [Rhodothermaceae bacterium]|nr:MAG: hypothetical protein KatS3mg042_0688 [Rhodothermaceae bacterium]
MTNARFSRWCRAYGRVWEDRDPDAAAALFTPDARYYETPFTPPMQGRDAIRAYWAEAVRGQRDITFSYRILSVSGMLGLAHCQASFFRVPGHRQVQLDGILAVELNEAGQSQTFREWWHHHETP